ncbi:NYN domain-containing protein [Halothiobacillus sp.]|uniref:NYN domain-containing protein n=1 Tax=Halothiobacillus sp. TaxID=1891311 RepID=UPI00262C11DB|nr:NYN domain-containing protein [Halothiobacillus sp.]MDD4967459.1 NYN domain-containing protein [Halothiobacillus sp.]
MTTEKQTKDVCIFWDNSNIYVPAQDVARDKDGATVGRDLRINFDHLYDLARAGRKVVAGVCVGSQPPELQDLWKRLRDVGVDLELFERGEDSGKEQAVDQALQVHMLRAALDLDPGVAVLLTGDGAGAHEGKGFFADLKRMHSRGWKVEVLSWESACHEGLKKWAQENGIFVPLDAHYESVTYIKSLRQSKKIARRQTF